MMKVLILNWRDIKNPESGGAEVLTHELAKGLIKKGHQVIWFASFFKGALKEEEIDGIRIIRDGHSDARYLLNSVHFKAFRLYRTKFKGKVDLVIDEVHGLPFFTPFYVKEKRIILICEVAGNLWFKIYGPFFGFFGSLIEKVYLRFYRSEKFYTISKSTEDELIENGIKKEFIKIIPMGIYPAREQKVVKSKNKLLFVGRLTKPKGIEDALLVLAQLNKDKPMYSLEIVGRGDDEYLYSLKNLILKLKIEKNVRFYGHVNESKKYKLMTQSFILISPSIKEGFGLTIPEAGFVGTPAIVYRSFGFVDHVKDGVNGIICKENTPQGIVNAIMKLSSNQKLYDTLSREAKKMARLYNWDMASTVAVKMLEQE